MRKKRCFVIMSFNTKYDNAYHCGIKKAIEDLELECVRIDEDAMPTNVPAAIVRELIAADVVIADVSESSPNVYYELGISHSMGNKTITISQEPDKLPFDTRNEYTLKYKNDHDGVRLLYFELKRVIPQLLARPHEPSNGVQIAGRDYFDLHRQIQENIKALAQERQNAQFFRDYLERQRNTDNSAVAEAVAREILDLPTRKRPVFVAVCGAAGVGKTRFSADLLAACSRVAPNKSVDVLPLDSFMLDRSERLLQNLSGYDTKANDISRVIKALDQLNAQKPCAYYKYDHETGEHKEEESIIQPCDVVILDGTHSFHPRLTPHIAYRIYIYAVPNLHKELRFLADLTERSYTAHQAFEHADVEYKKFEEFVLHYAKFADRVIEVESYWKYRI